jgi:hypothetical protein
MIGVNYPRQIPQMFHVKHSNGISLPGGEMFHVNHSFADTELREDYVEDLLHVHITGDASQIL